MVNRLRAQGELGSMLGRLAPQPPSHRRDRPLHPDSRPVNRRRSLPDNGLQGEISHPAPRQDPTPNRERSSNPSRLGSFLPTTPHGGVVWFTGGPFCQPRLAGQKPLRIRAVWRCVTPGGCTLGSRPFQRVVVRTPCVSGRGLRNSLELSASRVDGDCEVNRGVPSGGLTRKPA